LPLNAAHDTTTGLSGLAAIKSSDAVWGHGRHKSGTDDFGHLDSVRVVDKRRTSRFLHPSVQRGLQ
jgi:hypothetical protein